MKTRIITAAVLIALFIPVLFFSHTAVYPIVLLALAEVGLWELLHCVGQDKNLVAYLPAALLTALYLCAGRFLPLGEGALYPLLYLSAFTLLVWELCAAVFMKEKYTVREAGLVSTMTVYIAFGFLSMLLLRDSEGGEVVFVLPFLMPWISDSFAYFSGRAFGKHKLIPEVSPKKTVEGAIGALICTPLFAMLFGLLVSLFSDFIPNYPLLFAAGLIVSALSQCGDLIASLIKRQYGIKDYGKIFPGHGGVLDRFDSVLITGPFLLILQTLFVNMPFFRL